MSKITAEEALKIIKKHKHKTPLERKFDHFKKLIRREGGWTTAKFLEKWEQYDKKNWSC